MLTNCQEEKNLSRSIHVKIGYICTFDYSVKQNSLTTHPLKIEGKKKLRISEIIKFTSAYIDNSI